MKQLHASLLTVLYVVCQLAWTERAGAEGASATRPKLFLSCPAECFEDYLRQKLSYFDFARDPYLADYVVVVARQPVGSGGERFSVVLARPGALPREPSSFPAPSGTTAHVARDELAQHILRLLYAELAGSPHAASFELSLPPRGADSLSALEDPWNYWVLSPELLGEAEGGSGYHYAELTGRLTVRRITEPSKLRLRGSYTRSLSGYVLEDGSEIDGDVYAWDARALYAHSVGKRLAVGGVITTLTSEFQNLAHHVHGGPLLELNLFPYAENATRQLRFAYQAGAWANWYFEPSRRGLSREVRPYHALAMVVDVNQPWGSVQWVNQANQFLDEPARYRLSTGAIFTLRLFRGMAVSAEGMASLVRDQINLRARPVSDQELLLWTAQQPTNYLFESTFSLTYTFGSVHNTIVNPRFGRVDLEEE